MPVIPCLRLNNLDKKLLKLLLKNGESGRVEWKQQLNIANEATKAEFAKDVTAMANTSPGTGYILYGVTDIGQPVGIQKRKGLEECITQIVASRCIPPPEFSCEWIEENGKSILILSFPESQLKPHATNKKDIYIRRGKTIDKLLPAEIHQIMSQERRPQSTCRRHLMKRQKKMGKIIM